MEQQAESAAIRENQSTGVVEMSSSSSSRLPLSRRLQTRRSLLRHAAVALRSSPYNANTSASSRRQQRQSTHFTNSENVSDVNLPAFEEGEMEMLISEPHTSFLIEPEDDDDDDYDVVIGFSSPNPSPPTANSNQLSDGDFTTPIHLLTGSFDSDDDEDYDGYYSRVNLMSSSTEPLVVHMNNGAIAETTARHRFLEYPLEEENERGEEEEEEEEDEDLSIEIILETASGNTRQLNNATSTSTTIGRRRRRSILPGSLVNNRGFRLTDILSIPQKMYSSLKENFLDHEQQPQPLLISTQCYICLEEFQSSDSIKMLNCQHIFHAGCINEWLRGHSNCAYCRTAVLIDMLRTSPSVLPAQRRRRQTRVRRSNHTNPTVRLSPLQPVAIDLTTTITDEQHSENVFSLT